jgi:HK97 family phage portal protein
MSILRVVRGWFRFGGNSLGESVGTQDSSPTGSLISDVSVVGVDSALQISAVWAAVSLWAKTIGTLPLMAYESKNGNRTLARGSSLWWLFHETPNSRMTPAEFWIAMILNFMLRGNAYARIERDDKGEAYALWPMAADQVEVVVLKDGSVVYLYRVGSDIAALAEANVLHIKEMGNGTTGLSRLEYMRVTTSEMANAQAAANTLFRNGGKPTGVLMFDQTLDPGQRETLMERFKEMAHGTTSRLHILEVGMKYQQVNLTPQDLELLTTRQFGIQEIGRWFGTPSILLNQTEGTTTLGSSANEIIETFYKLNVRPALVSIEQAIRKRVLTVEQRTRYIVEFNFDALLRANLKDRMEIYAKATQNGIFTRNFCRQLENEPPLPGGDMLTAQVNLAPLEMLGKIKQTGGPNGTQDAIAQ